MILDGKATAAAIRAALRENIAKDREKAGRAPCLAVVLVGEDPASQVYVRNKEKACADAGIDTASYRKPASIPQKELEAFIASLNADPAVDGILLQLPLPEGLDARPCIDAISPEKDVDGLTAVNQGRVAMNVPGLRPCTPAGILAILDRYGISVSGKRAVVIGRSNLVGRPIALMLGSRDYNATVTMCHSRTPDLAAICREISPSVKKAAFLVHEPDKTVFICSDGTVDCGLLVRENASIYGGKGGGNKTLARAIFAKDEYIETFMDLIEKHLR